MNTEYGFFIQPEDKYGIVRISTTHQLRVWMSPRSDYNLDLFAKEMENASTPGIYILMAKKQNRVYVGESTNLYKRLKNHFENPDAKISDWEKVIIITNGRPASMSLFNDSIVRKSLEYLTGRLLKANKYNVVSQFSKQVPSPSQKNISQMIFDELTSLLLKQNIISKPLDEIGQAKPDPVNHPAG